jgi:WD40 repeat protein
VDQRDEAVAQRSTAQANESEAVRQATIADGGRLAASALLRLRDKPDLSYLLGIEALHKTDNHQSRDSLLTVLQSNPYLRRYLWSPDLGVSKVEFSPDGALLAVAGCGRGKPTEDGFACQQQIDFWDVARGESAGPPLVGYDGSIVSFGFSPDGRTVAAASSEHKVLLWDRSSGQAVDVPVEFSFGTISSIAFSPDGAVLALANDMGNIQLWDINRGQPIGDYFFAAELYFPLYHMVFSPDGRILAAGNYDGGVTLWDVRTQQPLWKFSQAFPAPVGSVAFSADGRMLAAGGCGKVIPDARDCYEGRIVVWDVTQGQMIGEPWSGHTGSVFALAFGLNDQILASGSFDGTILLWDTRSAVPLGAPLRGHTGSVYTLAVSPDGNLLASGSGRTVILWDLNSDHFLGQALALAPPEERTASAINAQGNLFAFGTRAGDIFLWNARDNGLMSQLTAKVSGPVSSLAFSPDDTLLASVACEKPDPEGTGCSLGNIVLWDVTSGQPLNRSFEGLAGNTSVLTFSPDGSLLASGSSDGTIGLWEVATGRALASFKDDGGSIKRLAFEADGATLIAVSSEGVISKNVVTRWQIPDGQMLGTPLEFPDYVPSLAVGPGGATLATGNRDDTVSLWDLATNQPIGQSLGQRALESFFYTLNVAFSADGRALASVHCIEKDELGLMCSRVKIVLWDLASGQPVGLPFTWNTRAVSPLLFNADGTALVTGGGDGTFMRWDLDPKSWIERACAIVRRNFTRDEWKQYFREEPYRQTCPQWPAGE